MLAIRSKIGACDPMAFFCGPNPRLQDRALVADAAQFLEQMDRADSAGAMTARQGGNGAAKVRAPTTGPVDESCMDESYPAPGPDAFAAVISAIARRQPQHVGYALRLLERMTAVHGCVTAGPRSDRHLFFGGFFFGRAV